MCGFVIYIQDITFQESLNSYPKPHGQVLNKYMKAFMSNSYIRYNVENIDSSYSTDVFQYKEHIHICAKDAAFNLHV